jgi:hypothetical protein
MANVCVPTQHNLNEVELLLHELQLRMTTAVLKSPRYKQCLSSPRTLYLVLADFFEAQRRAAQRAARIALPTVDVQSIWLFCLNTLHLQGLLTQHSEVATPDTLRYFLLNSPSLPLESLQQPAPLPRSCCSCTAQSSSEDGGDAGATASATSCRSLFSLVRPSLPSLLELPYVADRRMQRPTTTTTPSLSFLVLAAVSASLVPTLDRVQAVRWTAQLADATVEDALAGCGDSEEGEEEEGKHQRQKLRRTAALLLAGVWWVWGVLDEVHATSLHTLAEQLANDTTITTVGDALTAQTPSVPSSSSSAIIPTFSSFTEWLQRALRANGGVAHQQLYADDATARTGTAMTAEVEHNHDGEDDSARASTSNGAETENRGFWTQLAGEKGGETPI